MKIRKRARSNSAASHVSLRGGVDEAPLAAVAAVSRVTTAGDVFIQGGRALVGAV